MDTAISIRQVSKRYGAVTALDEVSLDIGDHEFFTLLGPSGCGKTTLLRIIAGFEAVSNGEVLLHGQDISRLGPNQRPVNTVFQHYSLFPHMSVAENVGFGLEMKRVPAAARKARVAEVLELVQLQDFASRKPHEMSGGQQQRVALARALAPEPEVLLLDEPLSALDLKLRQAMRLELKRIQSETGVTFIFVTHDQEEALTMSDRIAVMSDGELQQIGTATDIYQQPANRFVANFIGESNLLPAVVTDVAADLPHAAANGSVRISESLELPCRLPDDINVGTEGMLCIRPEVLDVELADGADNAASPHSAAATTATAAVPDLVLHGELLDQIYLGTDTQWVVRIDQGTTLTARQQNQVATALQPRTGARVRISADAGSCLFLEH